MTQRDAIQHLLDMEGVREACMRYWAGVDQKDPDLFGLAFTADAELSLFGGERVVRIADLIAAGKLGADYPHTCHTLANQTVSVSGDTATAISFVVAHWSPRPGRFWCAGCGTTTSSCATVPDGASPGASIRPSGSTTRSPLSRTCPANPFPRRERLLSRTTVR